MQFIITAYNATDEGVLERRLKVRPDHLENIARVKERGSVICAGGLTDGEGSPVGSFLVMEFESREMLDQYLESEPYATCGVWQDIKVETCNVVIMNDEMIGK